MLLRLTSNECKFFLELQFDVCTSNALNYWKCLLYKRKFDIKTNGKTCHQGVTSRATSVLKLAQIDDIL
jgi:hypothetical protein